MFPPFFLPLPKAGKNLSLSGGKNSPGMIGHGEKTFLLPFLEVYVCLAIPAQVVELLPQDMARVRVGESSTYLTASTMLLPEPAEKGDFLIVHAGFALHKVDPVEARESLAALREIAEAIDGQPANF